MLQLAIIEGERARKSGRQCADEIGELGDEFQKKYRPSGRSDYLEAV